MPRVVCRDILCLARGRLVTETGKTSGLRGPCGNVTDAFAEECSVHVLEFAKTNDSSQEGAMIQALPKRFSIECCKTKVITQANTDADNPINQSG